MRPWSRSSAVGISAIMVVLLAIMRSTGYAAEEAHSNASLQPGTQITYANWQRYKQFMPPAMQALFTGEYFWTMPADVQMEVGPTLPMPLPPAYVADTEKYSSQVKLKKLADAGYIPEGYTSGIPFPDPLH